MKICIGINSFKEEKDLLVHEKMCVESLYKIQKQFPCVDIVNIFFEDENFNYEKFINLNKLKQSSKNYFITNKKLPLVNDLFDVLADLNYDYFIFINNDIIVSDRYIKHILNAPEFETFVASKLHFTKLDSLTDNNSIPDAISVHGFDGFAVKTTWWKNNRTKFEKFFLGKPYWDTYFFTMCYLHSKCMILNKPPACIFHTTHESDAMAEDELTKFNIESFQKTNYVGKIWFSYVYDVLLKRQTHNGIKWYTPLPNEEDLEKQYLKL